MARLSKMGRLVEEDNEAKKLSTCFFCSEKIKEGGCWAGEYHIGVCKDCCHYLVDLLLDTMYDTNEEFRTASAEDKISCLEDIIKPIVIEKEKRRIEMDKYEKIKKLGLQYYSEIGIIDFFDGTMTARQFANTLGEYAQYKAEDILGCEEEIKSFVEERTGEKPHTVKFFGIPDNSYGMFRIACVAKISNNGSTFVFSSNAKYLKDIDIAKYDFNIERVY